jgi:haloacetate dehalogenase
MAGDVVALMRHLGHEQFAVVGHDRGSLVAFRTAMDHPQVVRRLVIMDGLPVVEHLERLNETFVRTWWHWWFLGQTEKPAERVINADPDAWYTVRSPSQMGAENHADLQRALHDPDVVHGMCEDYRAGLRIDRDHEAADRTAGRQIACPALVLSAKRDDIDVHGDPVRIWRPWVAGELHGGSVDCGHHQAEEAPGEVARALLEFLRGEA